MSQLNAQRLYHRKTCTEARMKGCTATSEDFNTSAMAFFFTAAQARLEAKPTGKQKQAKCCRRGFKAQHGNKSCKDQQSPSPASATNLGQFHFGRKDHTLSALAEIGQCPQPPKKRTSFQLGHLQLHTFAASNPTKSASGPNMKHRIACSSHQ